MGIFRQLKKISRRSGPQLRWLDATVGGRNTPALAGTFTSSRLTVPDLRLLENLLLSIFRSRIRRQRKSTSRLILEQPMRDTEEVSHLNSDRLKKLNAWKRDLKAHKAGEKFKEPYDGVRVITKCRKWANFDLMPSPTC